MKKYGTPFLFFSFAPIVGDALPLAAGWLRLSPTKSIFFIGIGKFARYCVILGGFWFAGSILSE
jgi:membrane protein YqaA with SNARE-associated domain